MWTLLIAGILLAQSADFNAQGVKALDARQYDAAIDLFTKAIAADSADYGAHFNLALAYSLAGKDPLAIPEYQKTLELKPGIFQAELNLGTSLFNTQRFQEAADAYARALALNVNSASANSAPAGLGPAELGMGRTLARLDRRAEAEPHYRKAAAADASMREFLLELAGLYEASHQDAEAIALYREFPENPGAQERAGVLLLRSGKPAEAIAALESAVAKSPTAANRLALAEAYAKNRQPAKAEPLVAQALGAAPDDFELRMFYGRLLRDQRKLQPAAEQFLASAKLKPPAHSSWSFFHDE